MLTTRSVAARSTSFSKAVFDTTRVISTFGNSAERRETRIHAVAMPAGQTTVILASTSFVRGDFGAANASRLAGQTINYIHVASVDAARQTVSPSAVILEDVRTRGGTRELLVDDCGDLFILAEQMA